MAAATVAETTLGTGDISTLQRQKKPTQQHAHILPPNFLTTQPNGPQITRTNIDFPTLGLPEYTSLFATILDNCFTPHECALLVSAAEGQAQAQAPNKPTWEPAMINIGSGQQMLIPDSRDCGRIIWDDRDIVERIWNRVKDEVPELKTLVGVPKITGNGPAKRKEVWCFERLNERMRFLRYGEGQYFRPHCDGTYETPDRSERSFITLHLYLNDATNDNIGGGATTFHSMNMKTHHDVLPKVGRVLIFQHRGLLHSGADVTSGIKLTLRTDLMYRRVTE